MKKILLFLLIAALPILSFQSFAQDSDYFVGQWEVTVQDTPNGTVKVLLTLERVDGKLKGKFTDTSTGGETSISQITEQDNSITLYFFAEGYDLYLTVKPDGADKVSGTLADSFIVIGQRVKS
jgi:hypothetical protein